MTFFMNILLRTTQFINFIINALIDFIINFIVDYLWKEKNHLIN